MKKLKQAYRGKLMDNYELEITNYELNGTTKDTKSTKFMPQIRFKGFSDEWERNKTINKKNYEEEERENILQLLS